MCIKYSEGKQKNMYKSKFQTINKADKQQNVEKDRKYMRMVRKQ